MSHVEKFLNAASEALLEIDRDKIWDLASALGALRNEGRLFLLGVGGSAANASHAVNDFRKLCGIEAYCVSDNVAELTARINDEGWKTCFSTWLAASRLNRNDAIMVFSVGGGNALANVSVNIVEAVKYAKSRGAKVFGIVGRDGGYTAHHGDCVVIVPDVDKTLTTPIAEAFQALVWHAIVSHPNLAIAKAKWESTTR